MSVHTLPVNRCDSRLPNLTHHARQRCIEMRIPTRVAQWIVQHPDMDRPAPMGRRMAVADACPDFAVVYAEQEDGEPPVIITVLFRTYDEYERSGATYVPANMKKAVA